MNYGEVFGPFGTFEFLTRSDPWVEVYFITYFPSFLPAPLDSEFSQALILAWKHPPYYPFSLSNTKFEIVTSFYLKALDLAKKDRWKLWKEARLTIILSITGRPHSIEPGRAIYRAAFCNLTKDQALKAWLDLRVIARFSKIEWENIYRYEPELALLAFLPEEAEIRSSRIKLLQAVFHKFTRSAASSSFST